MCLRASVQLDLLRKKVASLDEAILAKDRENVTNRQMYDNMKGVSRKIKEVSLKVSLLEMYLATGGVC